MLGCPRSPDDYHMDLRSAIHILHDSLGDWASIPQLIMVLFLQDCEEEMMADGLSVIL